jgi:hypothetical protein
MIKQINFVNNDKNLNYRLVWNFYPINYPLNAFSYGRSPFWWKKVILAFPDRPTIRSSRPLPNPPKRKRDTPSPRRHLGCCAVHGHAVSYDWPRLSRSAGRRKIFPQTLCYILINYFIRNHFRPLGLSKISIWVYFHKIRL